MKQTLPWRRILAEGAVILVSILLAFAVDSWWDASQAREEEDAAIESLVAEIDNALQELDQSLAAHTRSMCSAVRWRDVTEATPLDSAVVMVARLRGHRTPSLSLSTVSAVLSSGELTLIEDPRLKGWVSAWPGVRDDFEEELDGIIQFARFIVPEYFVSAGIPMPVLGPEQYPLHVRESIRPLLGDPGFQALMAQGQMLNEILVREGRFVRSVLTNGAGLSQQAATGQSRAPESGLQRFAGTFRPSEETRDHFDLPEDWSLTTSVELGQLVLAVPTGQSSPLTPAGEAVFYLSASERFEFVLEGGRTTGYTVWDVCDTDQAPGTWTLVQ